ncbi:hypothetical protein [Nocardioides sp. W7]|uniref:hypothetical protein n=1 Tax=Nocardioides sp. W7 TaxID=2931390 RepID=UPI001FD2333C|nr:hypothetical protein [Nocardioides sp. W7]
MTLAGLRVPRPVLADLAVGALVAFVILGPLLTGGGYWLFGDMVFVPRQPWKDSWLGLDGSLPRAVPMDALVSVLSGVVPGAWLQRIFLVGAFLAGAAGAGRLVRPAPWYARAAAITLLLWNPWVHERLLIGQWAILAGYLLLPAVAVTALRVRDSPRRGLPGLAVVLVLSAVCSPSSGVMAAVVALVLAIRPTRLHLVGTGTVALVANLPWLVPSLLAGSSNVSVSGVFAAFAARGESAAGVLPSLFSLGGIWKSSVVAPERTGVALVVLSCGLTLVALAGLRRARHWDAPVSDALPRLALLAVGSFVVAAVPAWGPGAAALERLAEVVPGLALLRDSHRFLAPMVLLLLPGVAGAVTWLREQVRRGREALWAAVGSVVLAPLLLLPSLAWGELGELRPSSYPTDWSTVAQLLEDDPGRTVVLPWYGGYRGFEWNGWRAVLDPAPRLLPGEVLVDDRTILADAVVPAEDPRSSDVGAALAASDPAAELRDLGVRWVVVEHGMDRTTPPEGTVVHAGDDLSLIDLGPGAAVSQTASSTVPIVVGDALATVLLSGAIVVIIRRRVSWTSH